MDRITELSSGFRRIHKSDITGNRTKHVITFNPNKAKPGESVYVDIPKLNSDLCLVPDSVYLRFDFKNANTKSWFKNNLGNLLQKGLRIKISGQIIYENTGESIFNVYKDLWLKDSVRSNMIEDGIGTLAIRKKISKDDAQNDDANAKIAYDVYGTKQRIHLSKIISDHGLYSAFNLPHWITFDITLPSADEIMEAQSGQKVDGYTLENIELEYETIDKKDLAKEITEKYMVGRTLLFEHVTLLKTIKWDKDATIVNETINIPRTKMRGILMLFREKGETDLEKFMNPNITSVKITIEGVPNMVYSQGLPSKRIFEEAQRLFEHNMEDPEMKVTDFYKDKYALWIDLRTTSSKNTVNEGKKLVQTQSGLLLEIGKTATTKDLTCYIFILSDATMDLAMENLQK